ncbi:MAG TPA: ribonuclease III [Rhodothermales bacterium]|nr:ribonuclease III [Rhodothermales bacterium]
MSLLQTLRTLFHSPDSPAREVSAYPPGTDLAPEVSRDDALRRDVERIVGVAIGDPQLYRLALMHRSMLRGQPDSHLFSNERLEFLGDAVLGFVVAEDLYDRFPDQNEGFLTRLRSKLVNGAALADAALRIGLDRLVLISENMEQTGGRTNQTILADAFEAVVGALYLDQGMGAARRFIHGSMLNAVDLGDLATRRDNYKSILLEYAQSIGQPQPRYRVVAEEGPSHEKTFTVEVLIAGKPYGRGTAPSKKMAEQQAAREALDYLQHAAHSADGE